MRFKVLASCGSYPLPERGSDFREMAMSNKMRLLALGYVLLVASPGFALDLSIAAMIV
jgi:hypothetical protein